jgi:hypothetical protein
MKTIYQLCIEAGVPVTSHASDLYIPVNETTTAILKKFPKATVSTFKCNITKQLYYDVSFEYMPFWDKVVEKAKEQEAMNEQRQTFWFYYGKEPIYSVRLPKNTPHEEVRKIALENHERCPLCPDGLRPFEVANRIQHGEIKTFND